MSTPYSSSNQKFSDNAHMLAQEEIYPKLFNVSKTKINFTTTSLSVGEKEKILDGEMDIDRIVSISVEWFRAEIEFTIQERFRRVKYAKYKDITITEWNCETNQKSELFKLNAGIFVYGYFDLDNNKFIDWVAVNTVGLLSRIVKKAPTAIRANNPRSNQDFLTFKFDHLQKAGLIMSRM